MAGHVRRAAIGLGTAASVALVAGSLSHRLPVGIVEVLGFLTGAGCVWLTVEESVWNWPLGIANGVCFVVVFLQARLFASAGLEALSIPLGLVGWYWWSRSGWAGADLGVSRARPRELAALAVLLGAGTWALTALLAGVGDSAPLLDALTTALNLVAQYLLTRKLVENWLVCIGADAISVALYLSHGLVLTALLSALMLALSVAGLLRWRRALRAIP